MSDITACANINTIPLAQCFPLCIVFITNPSVNLDIDMCQTDDRFYHHEHAIVEQKRIKSLQTEENCIE